jgi:tRNA nucleotidyltransferase (CCA-adding enzyme)
MALTVITTHLNADFDGLASMIAAQKLYPGSLLVFPGSQEKNVREFLQQNQKFTEHIRKIRDISLNGVDTLILVDTCNPNRLGPFAACLDIPQVKVHIYDHHLDTCDSLASNISVVENLGSTTTILVNLLRKRNIPISTDEATLFALGIYEDTGSFTHLSTTPGDLTCAAWLVEQGARLDEVAQYISHDLTTEQLTILHQLAQKARQYTIQDIPVVVVTHSLPDYVDEFSLIVRRFMAMENLNVVFALLSMNGRTYLIARSRIADVNVGNIARDLGGGGHATAASATIRDLTLIEAEEKLIHSLHRHIHPQPIASEMMSKPAITIQPEASIREAQALLTRYNITAAPVKDAHAAPSGEPGGIVGIISRRIVEKANHHHLGDRPVSEYMATEVQSLPLDATLADIQELIIEHRQRLIPIIDDDQLIGVITRTDLLNRLVNDPAHLPKDLLHEADHPSLERTRNLNSLMVELLSRETIQLLQIVGEVAQKLSYRAFAVGGFVRDLLLKKPNLDLDVVIEGDGIVFAKALAAKLKGRYRTHERFKTAVVLMPDGFKIDIATARLEYYEYPAAMPTVELSSIKLDLSRRDFTINAMAIHLNPEHFGTLIDFFNCQHDLKQKLIKVLHNLSFVEDPSRIFRAVRFEQRMGFQISPHTKRLIQNAVAMKLFGKTDDSRFFSEMKIICAEKNPIPAIRRLTEFDLFKFLWPNLPPHYQTDRRFLHQLTRAQEAISWFQLLYLDETCQNWMVYLLTIMAKVPTEELHNFCMRFSETPKNTQFLLDQKELCAKALFNLAKSETPKPSQIVAYCQDISIEGLLHLMAMARKKHVQKAISLYVTTLRHVESELSGRDLVAIGYTPGPLFKQILQYLRNQRLDNPDLDRDDELELVRKKFPKPI